MLVRRALLQKPYEEEALFVGVSGSPRDQGFVSRWRRVRQRPATETLSVRGGRLGLSAEVAYALAQQSETLDCACRPWQTT